MKYVNIPPTDVGTYWWRLDEEDRSPSLHDLTRAPDGKLYAANCSRSVDTWTGQWSARLCRLADQERAYREGFKHGSLGERTVDEHYSTSETRSRVEGE